MTLLTPDQAADFLQVSPRTLRFWRHIGKGPSFCKLGANTVRYTVSDLEQYIEAQRGLTSLTPRHREC